MFQDTFCLTKFNSPVLPSIVLKKATTLAHVKMSKQGVAYGSKVAHLLHLYDILKALSMPGSNDN